MQAFDGKRRCRDERACKANNFVGIRLPRAREGCRTCQDSEKRESANSKRPDGQAAKLERGKRSNRTESRNLTLPMRVIDRLKESFGLWSKTSDVRRHACLTKGAMARLGW